MLIANEPYFGPAGKPKMRKKKKQSTVSKSDLINKIIAQRKAEATESGKPARWGRGFMLLPEQEKTISDMYAEGGHSFAEMARRASCSIPTVTRTLERKGLRKRAVAVSVETT